MATTLLAVKKTIIPLVLIMTMIGILTNCQTSSRQEHKPADTLVTVETAYKDSVVLPDPYATKSVTNFSKVVGWPETKTPIAPPGFKVTKYADGLRHPRWIYVAPNGDILVAESNTKLKGIKKIASEFSGKIKSQGLDEDANGITLL